MEELRGFFIFSETDSAFDLALHIFEQLKENRDELQGNSEILYHKIMSIRQIRNVKNTLTFEQPIHFCRTASASFRICFLQCVNIDTEYWFSTSECIKKQNILCIEETGETFSLANNKDDALFWYSKYDQLNPPFVIKHKIGNQAQSNTTWTSRMIIIQNLEFLIFVTTDINIRRNFAEYDCQVSVTCDRYRFTNTGNLPPRYLNPLRMLRDPKNFEVNERPRPVEEIPDASDGEDLSSGSEEEPEEVDQNQVEEEDEDIDAITANLNNTVLQ